MVTAVTHRGWKTRQTILETAAQLFHGRGVNATSVDDILAASNTGKSQFYHYYKSKDDLLRDVIRHHLERFIESSPFMAHLDTWEGIRAWFDAAVSLLREADCVGG